jgi:hypothetical protein
MPFTVLVNTLHWSLLLLPFSIFICCKIVQLPDVKTFPGDVLIFDVLKNPEYPKIFPCSTQNVTFHKNQDCPHFPHLQKSRMSTFAHVQESRMSKLFTCSRFQDVKCITCLRTKNVQVCHMFKDSDVQIFYVFKNPDSLLIM